MARRTIIGPCHLCGHLTKLSFEHVPPRSAFNDRPIVTANIRRLISKEVNLDDIEGRTSQRGAGAYTLCEQCNNLTGQWYGNAFADWTYQAMLVLQMAKGKPTLYYSFRIFPLRVIKQITCMFFSTNGENFRTEQQDLVRFVLNRERKYLDTGIRVFCFYNPSNRSRQSGVAGILNFNTHSTRIVSEIVFPPMGYVMSLDSGKPDDSLFEITFLAEYSYNDWKEISLRLPVLPIYTYFPTDYRSREEVLESARKDRIEE